MKRRITVAVEQLTSVVRAIAASRRKELEHLKRSNHWDRDDFIWEALLVSMATMGSSRGAVLVTDEQFHKQVRWTALEALTEAQCHERLRSALHSAKVRMPDKKARWLVNNWMRIREAGGPAEVKTALQSCHGRDKKIRFLDSFEVT